MCDEKMQQVLYIKRFLSINGGFNDLKYSASQVPKRETDKIT